MLPIQGPPGSGKTYTGARMIVELVGGRQEVGVAANSHKVIGNVLDEVAEGGDASSGVTVRIGQKPKAGQDADACDARPSLTSNAAVAAALATATIDVVGRLAWMWARAEMPARALDVLVVDEAGQMSLANVLACAGGADRSSCSATRSSSISRSRAPTRRAPSAAPSATCSAIPRPRRPGDDRPDAACSSTRRGGSTRTSAPSRREVFYAGRLRPRER